MGNWIGNFSPVRRLVYKDNANSQSMVTLAMHA